MIDNEGFRIPRRFLARDAVDGEIERLALAIETSATEITNNRDSVDRQLGSQYGAIFEAHLQMLRDPRLRSELEELIRHRQYSAEYAVSRALRRYAKVFESLESSYLADRTNDIADIARASRSCYCATCWEFGAKCSRSSRHRYWCSRTI